ncbi:Protein of uncharacterised function (DUF1602) [Chlamydia trachomatis]|nr:Protein of uncharacterised function (DUF1602) [Chlamydia trachomatis]
MIRRQKLAAYASCVTIMMVEILFSFSSLKLSSRPVADFESSAPVGSSARINAGSVTSALAAAVLCFCPPEIWYGYLANKSSIPNTLAIRFTNAVISFAGIFAIASGNNIFSFTVNESSKL